MAYRLKIQTSKKTTTYYVTEDIYVNGRKSTGIAERIGNTEELAKQHPDQDPEQWARAYVERLRAQDKQDNQPVIVKHLPRTLISHGQVVSYNVGYLFIQQIYYRLGLDKLCHQIKQEYQFSYDLNQILSYLLYARMLRPGSKRALVETAKTFLQPVDFQVQQIYRSLSVLSQENERIQEWLYKKSAAVCERKTSILYYDLTNFYFEIEEEDIEGGSRKYGLGKENRPNPIVQLGLLMDGNGIPLAFDITPGNTNEQGTMKPLEQRILKDFDISKFVICTDAGLSSMANRKFNSLDNRAFVTTQSLKKMVKHLKEWALDPTGWRLLGSEKQYNLKEIDTEDDLLEETNLGNQQDDRLYYKERWINEKDFEQRLIVTFSPKQQRYQRHIRAKQIQRAQELIERNPGKLTQKRQTDYKRLIHSYNLTPEGELADKAIHHLSQERIAIEEQYDGFYAVCTNLDGGVRDLLKINKGRWQIEETFRLMKHDFKSRPVYLQRDDRIRAHFLTCYITLLIYRILVQALPGHFTSCEILDTLRQMNLHKVKNQGFIPSYTRTDLTDALHELAGFRTDYEINTHKHINKILRQSKK